MAHTCVSDKLTVTEKAWLVIVFIVVNLGENLDEWAVGLMFLLAAHRSRVRLRDFRDPFRSLKFFQRFALAPRVPLAGFVIDLLVLFGFFEFVRVVFEQADPFVAALEETEEAAGSASPIVVVWKTDSACL